MIPINTTCYEFEDFVLNPRDRLLLHFERPVELAARDFDLLLYFVENPNSLIRNEDLIKAVWGDGAQIHTGNVSNHIAKIRRALNCDPQYPRFIKTTHGKHGYRFIADVRRTDATVVQVAAATSREFSITGHLFVPVYLGANSFDNLRSDPKETRWARYREFKIDNGVLCIFPSGIGVWHLMEAKKFGTLSDVAIWRRDSYNEILNGRHILSFYTEELAKQADQNAGDLFKAFLKMPGYVFSVLLLDELRRANLSKMKAALQLLSCLTPLEKTGPESKETAKVDLERQFLNGSVNNIDIREFGLAGCDMGFATWNGLSYHCFDAGSSGSAESIVQFEAALQGTWWLAKCIFDVCLSNGINAKGPMRGLVEQLRFQLAKLTAINATETTSQRTMIEAALNTSRLERLANDTIRLFSEL